ncbi:MAG: site-specific integrase [Alkalispirochaeta sp.]
MKQNLTPFKRKNGKYYYFHYYDRHGQRKTKGTNVTLKWQALQFIEAFIADLERPPDTGIRDMTFAEYAESFFVPDRCPHIQRLLDDGRSIGTRHIRESRNRLTNDILTDELATIPITKITRGDLLDFRSRLQAKFSANSVNKVMKTLKTVFTEALYRQDIESNPAAGIGNIKYEKSELGIFTVNELFSFFPASSLGPWKDSYDYTCFLIAATTGMRRSEILALRWQNVDFDSAFVHVVEAWKDPHELGKPKWNKTRVVPISTRTVESLKALKANSKTPEPEDLVFSYADGQRFGGTWWQKRFRKAMGKAQIDWATRNLKPHSFRHTLNTLLRNAGQDPAKIRAALGWSDESIQENYTHWQIEHLKGQAQIIDT